MFEKNKGIIFGATGLIGSQIAHEMTKKGAKLILHGTSKKKLEKLDDHLKHKFNLRQILRAQHQFSNHSLISSP